MWCRLQCRSAGTITLVLVGLPFPGLIRFVWQNVTLSSIKFNSYSAKSQQPLPQGALYCKVKNQNNTEKTEEKPTIR